MVRCPRGRATATVALAVALCACAPAPPLPSPAPFTSTAMPSVRESPAIPSPATGSATPSSPCSSPTTPPGWERSPDQAAFAGTGFTGIAWTGSRFLATLQLGESIVDSDDGRTWHRQPPFQTTPWTAGPGLVAAGPAGVVAVGGGDGTMAAWVSGDGLTWSMVPDQPALQSRDGAFGGLGAVIPSQDGWLGVGGEFYMNAPTRALLRGVVLVSAYGSQWTRVPDQPSLEYAQLNDVVCVPAGYVAVGAVVTDPTRGDSGLRAAVWTSPDGLAWTRADGPEDFPVPQVHPGEGPVDVVLHSVAAQGSRLVAVGDVTQHGDATGPGAVMAWWSDGESWAPVRIEQLWPHAPLSVTAVPGGFYAFLGRDPSCTAGAWSSADGSAWQCLDDPAFEGCVVTGAAVSPGREVLVGHCDTTGESTVASAWTRPLP